MSGRVERGGEGPGGAAPGGDGPREAAPGGGPRDLAFTGPMGAGKSTVGRLVAGFLGRRFLDLDEAIEQRTGRTVAQLFAEGEAVFRAAEGAALREWLARPAGAPAEVVSLGGGTLQDEGLAAALRGRTLLVHLDAPAPVLAHRLDLADVRVRPLLLSTDNLLETLAELRQRRAPGYAQAHLRLATQGRGAHDVAVALLRTLHDPDDGPWREEPVALAGDGSVTTGRGALPFEAPRGAALLWDTRLPRAHAEPLLPRLTARAGGRLLRLEREGGEACKTADGALAAWREMLAGGVDRDTPLWVVGGGTVGDLGGFVAHGFKRGVPLCLLPTTLVAQLDAALGGKNGINLDRTKNIVGTIRLPEHVHLDPLFLVTLSDVDLRGGLAEAVKSGLIGDPGLVDLVERERGRLGARPLPALEQIANRAAAVKLGIVGRDLHEAGERRLLNLGHTLGHALEAATAGDERPLAHGDAVAIGTVFAARLARRAGVLADAALPDRVEALFRALGLPVRVPDFGPFGWQTLGTALGRDKKRFRGETLWILPVACGRMAIRTVPHEDVLAELEDFRRSGP